MREIKFRVWTAIYLKENDYQPVYKMFYPTSFGCNGGQFGWSDKGHLDLGSISEKNYNEQNHTILQQYTGVKDKNGKEIYEGDIIRGKFRDTDYNHLKTINAEVVWIERYACFNIGVEEWRYSGEPVTVIGNIFENRELLK